MAENLWTIIPHVIPASHIGGFSRRVRNEQTDHLQLAVKQYVPRNRRDTAHGITLIATPGAGQSKELFEPFFDELLRCGLPLRCIWTFDAVHMGASYVLNEQIIGDEHNWFDYSRDLVQIINHFQTEMPPPIYGIGTSLGCVAATMASISHRRLFTGIISVEPVFGTGNNLGSWLNKLKRSPRKHRAWLMMKRRDFWPTRDEARRSFSANPFFKRFDPKVFEKVIQYDLRDCPTPEHPRGVTLTTPKSLELASILLPDPPFDGFSPGPEYVPGGNNILIPGFYRGEVEFIVRALPSIYSPTLYVWGEQSDIGMSDYATRVVDTTGTGIEGAGGRASGQVESVYVDAGHDITLEQPKKAAEAIAAWIRKQHQAWSDKETAGPKPPFNPAVINPLWLKRINKL